MAVAALIISILALVCAVASLAVQITLGVQKLKPKAPSETEEFLKVSDKELEKFFTATSSKDQEKMNDIMENPDYSGINEEFNI